MHRPRSAFTARSASGELTATTYSELMPRTLAAQRAQRSGTRDQHTLILGAPRATRCVYDADPHVEPDRTKSFIWQNAESASP
jgi:hypothetical protein